MHDSLQNQELRDETFARQGWKEAHAAGRLVDVSPARRQQVLAIYSVAALLSACLL